MIQHGAETAMVSSRYPPTLLHLAVMANNNDENDGKGTREFCIALLLLLLPMLCEDIELQDESGNMCNQLINQFMTKILQLHMCVHTD